MPLKLLISLRQHLSLRSSTESQQGQIMGVAVLQHIRYYHRLVPLNAYTSFLPAGWHFIWYFAFTPINVKFTKMPQFKFLQSIRIDSDFDCLFDVVCWYHPTLYHHHSTPRLLNAEETTNRRRQRQRPQ